MTDILKGFIVTLTTDMREDDAEQIRFALSMVKGVLTVDPVMADSGDWMARQRIKAELRQALLEALDSPK